MSTRVNVSPLTREMATAIERIRDTGIPDKLIDACKVSDAFFSLECEFHFPLYRCAGCAKPCHRCNYFEGHIGAPTAPECRNCTKKKETSVACRNCNRTVSWEEAAEIGDKINGLRYGSAPEWCNRSYWKQFHYDHSDWCENTFGPFKSNTEGLCEYLREVNVLILNSVRQTIRPGDLGGCHFHFGTSKMLIDATTNIVDFNNEKRLRNALAGYLVACFVHRGIRNMGSVLSHGETPVPITRNVGQWANHIPRNLNSWDERNTKEYIVHPHANGNEGGRLWNHIEFREGGGIGRNMIPVVQAFYRINFSPEKIWKDFSYDLLTRLDPRNLQKVTRADFPKELIDWLEANVIGPIPDDWDVRAAFLRNWKQFRYDVMSNGQFMIVPMEDKEITRVVRESTKFPRKANGKAAYRRYRPRKTTQTGARPA